MIAKVGTSTSIQKTSHYLASNEERVSWKESHNLASRDREFVTGQMEKAAAMSRTDQPIYHYSISWDPSDNPSKKQMIEVARQTLNDLGLGEHQALIVAHSDHDYKHLHVMANRVHPETGIAWDRWMDYRKLEKSLRTIEREYGWQEVPGHHHQLEGQQKPPFGRSFNRMEAAKINRGELPFFAMVREVAQEDFRSAEHWMDLHQRLTEYGLTIQRGSRGAGGKITDGSSVANLSKIHRDFSMNKLTQRFGPFKSLEQLQERTPLTDRQKTFLRFERALRMDRTSRHSLKKGLQKTLKALGTAKRVQNTLNNFLTLTTPQNPAFKIVRRMGKTIIKQLQPKQQQQTLERGR